MINTKTVFILGAGASVPYNYPTGAGLRNDICRNFPNRIGALVKTQYAGASQLTMILATTLRDANNFCQTFFKSSTPSIDLFLARNDKFVSIGKEAIVTSILAAEENSRFREDMRTEFQDHDWYSYIFQKMTEGMINVKSYGDFSQNRVTFITFNYERSLEHFLYESLRNSFSSVPESQIQAQFSKIKIYHVYGTVDRLPWQRGFIVSYGQKPLLSNLEALTRNIRVIHERNSDGLDDAKRAIQDADRVFFLGFGYAKENLDILELPSLLKNQEIFGTSFGSTEKEIRETKYYLRSYYPSERIDSPLITNIDSKGLLREYL